MTITAPQNILKNTE